MLHLFAHKTGEPHIETPQTAGNWEFVLANLAPFALLAALWLAMHLLKIRPATKLTIVMVYFLIAGLTLFQVAPIASIISLIAGFGLSLSTLLLQAKR